MLRITIPSAEHYNELTNEFTNFKEQSLQLEHSLVSISKWESKWCKPFLSRTEKTTEETIDYIKCMNITQGIDESIFDRISNGNIKSVKEYIDSPMTATTFSKDDKPPSREIITSEVIYYWMVTLNIPFECQKWHLNRLLTLVNVCNIKNSPPKKMNKRDLAKRNSSLNAARKQKYGQG